MIENALVFYSGFTKIRRESATTNTISPWLLGSQIIPPPCCFSHSQPMPLLGVGNRFCLSFHTLITYQHLLLEAPNRMSVGKRNVVFITPIQQCTGEIRKWVLSRETNILIASVMCYMKKYRRNSYVCSPRSFYVSLKYCCFLGHPI